MRWDKNAWPVVNGDGTIALQMDVPTLPQQPLAKKSPRTDFKGEKLGPEWVHIRNNHPENYTLVSGKLRLKAAPVSLNDDKPVLLLSDAGSNIPILQLPLLCSCKRHLLPMKRD